MYVNEQNEWTIIKTTQLIGKKERPISYSIIQYEIEKTKPKPCFGRGAGAGQDQLAPLLADFMVGLLADNMTIFFNEVDV